MIVFSAFIAVLTLFAAYKKNGFSAAFNILVSIYIFLTITYLSNSSANTIVYLSQLSLVGEYKNAILSLCAGITVLIPLSIYTQNKKTALPIIKILLILALLSALGVHPMAMQIMNAVKGSSQIERSAYVPSFEMRQDASRYIAHAGGGIDGQEYTNSLEALNRSYDKGFRLLELDIITTSDNAYVAAHDWNTWQKMTGYQGQLPPTLADFRKYKIKHRYSPIGMDEINKWFAEHQDAKLITDKVNSPARFIKEFTAPDRLIMELFSVAAIKEASELNFKGIMPTFKVVKRMKGDVVGFFKKYNIHYVSSSVKIDSKSLYLISELAKAGVKTYGYHIGNKPENNEEYAVSNLLDIFYGIYADEWDFGR